MGSEFIKELCTERQTHVQEHVLKHCKILTATVQYNMTVHNARYHMHSDCQLFAYRTQPQQKTSNKTTIFLPHLVLFMNIFYLPVVRNDILAYLLPNCSNQLLMHDIISHHPVISNLHVPVYHMQSSLIFIFVFLIVCWCQNARQKSKNVIVNILLLYTDRTAEKGLRNFVKVWKIYP